MKVGFIGLGIMGLPMAKNILKNGYELHCYTHKEKTIEEMEKLGAKGEKNALEVAENSDVVITMLPDSANVKEISEEIKNSKNKFTLIDMSSIDPIVSKEIGAELEKLGKDMLDCPVSGGEPKAIDGTLSIMCGGKKETFEKYNELLKAMGTSVTYVGELGAGNTCKLANQMIVASNIAVLSEALTFAKKAGANPELVFNAIKGGLAGSEVMNAKAPMMLEENYKPGFRIDLHIKDLKNALNAAHSINMPTPITAQMLEIFEVVKNDNGGSLDH